MPQFLGVPQESLIKFTVHVEYNFDGSEFL